MSTDGVASHYQFNLPTTWNDCCVCAVRHLMTVFPICKLPERQGRRQDFWFGGANLAAKGSPAWSAAPGIARGVWGHAPPENFVILGNWNRIPTHRQFWTVA